MVYWKDCLVKKEDQAGRIGTPFEPEFFEFGFKIGEESIFTHSDSSICTLWLSAHADRWKKRLISKVEKNLSLSTVRESNPHRLHRTNRAHLYSFRGEILSTLCCAGN
jgi:hypothetical protein